MKLPKMPTKKNKTPAELREAFRTLPSRMTEAEMRARTDVLFAYNKLIVSLEALPKADKVELLAGCIQGLKEYKIEEVEVEAPVAGKEANIIGTYIVRRYCGSHVTSDFIEGYVQANSEAEAKVEFGRRLFATFAPVGARYADHCMLHIASGELEEP